MLPNSNDDLNNLVGKMSKGPYTPPQVPPPPIVGGGTGQVFQPGGQGAKMSGGLKGCFFCVGLFILLTTVLPFFLTGWLFSNTDSLTKFAMDFSSYMPQGLPEAKNTTALSGDPTRFDPIEGYTQAVAYAGEQAELIGMKAKFVKPDGTMDLMASYHAQAEYEFVRKLDEPPKDAPPVGAGGSIDDVWYEPVIVSVYEPGQVHHVTSMGGNYSYSGTYVHKGMKRDVRSPVSKLNDKVLFVPSCSFVDFWKEALVVGAPKTAVAVIEYSEKGYDFSIQDTGIDLHFENDCSLNETKSRFGHDGTKKTVERVKAEAPIEAVEPGNVVEHGDDAVGLGEPPKPEYPAEAVDPSKIQ